MIDQLPGSLFLDGGQGFFVRDAMHHSLPMKRQRTCCPQPEDSGPDSTRNETRNSK